MAGSTTAPDGSAPGTTAPSGTAPGTAESGTTAPGTGAPVTSEPGTADSGTAESSAAAPDVSEGVGSTRRFPLRTRSTARPEGGGRAAGKDAPAPARQWPILAVLGSVAVGLVLVAADAFRAGTVLIGAALLVGALLRWLLPSVGMLAVRSRFTDVITYGGLGTVIVLLALMAQPKPILEIPFLEDIIRFTVR